MVVVEHPSEVITSRRPTARRLVCCACSFTNLASSERQDCSHDRDGLPTRFVSIDFCALLHASEPGQHALLPDQRLGMCDERGVSSTKWHSDALSCLVKKKRQTVITTPSESSLLTKYQSWPSLPQCFREIPLSHRNGPSRIPTFSRRRQTTSLSICI